MAHSIRLRGPWQCQPLARTTTAPDGSVDWTEANLPPAGAIELPGDWSALLGAEFGGLARLTRGFGLPTGLSPKSRVWLEVAEVAGIASVTLNANELGCMSDDTDLTQVRERLANLPPPFASLLQTTPQPCPARWDVTSLLLSRNEVVIDLVAFTVGRVGLVTLQIEEDDVTSALLESNPAFQALVAKSKASPRKPFGATPAK